MLGTPVFGEFLPFFSAKFSQALSGWMGTVAAQLFSEMFDQVQAWALAGPLKEIQRLVPKDTPALSWLCD